MKKTIITLVAFLSIASSAVASDSIAVGVRAGVETNSSSQFYEAFGDLYLNRLVSIGATAGYVLLDHKDLGSIRRDESLPITALFKVHAPIPFVKPYAGLGEALIFHNKHAVTGSPVLLVGVNISPLPMPLFLNIEYRRQLNSELDFLAGGVGVAF
jgi:hypothetical protein